MKNKIKRIAIIAAAGEGKRCLPITKVIPKEMFPIKNKPAIHYLIEEARNMLADEIIVVISKSKLIIKEYIEKYMANDIKIYFQKEPKGLLSLLHEFNFKNNEVINLILGDEVIFYDSASIKKIKKSSQSQNLILVNANLSVEDKKRYGMFSIEKNKILHFKEKPKKNLDKYSHAAIGRYFFRSNDLYQKKYKSANELDVFITDLIKGSNLEILDIGDNKYDISTPEGLGKANL